VKVTTDRKKTKASAQAPAPAQKQIQTQDAKPTAPTRSPSDLAPADLPSAAVSQQSKHAGLPSRTIYRPQLGKKAQVDLRNWHPHAIREAHLRDAVVVYRMLKDLPPAVTFYGGARIKEEDPYFKLSSAMGALLASCGVPVRTGAGPGMMTSVLEGFEAQLAHSGVDPALAFPTLKTTKGLKKATSELDLRTQGFRIALPFEQEWSPFVHVGAQQELFPLRKQALRDNARGLVSLPGGFGTLDEMFEGWALSGLGVHNKPMAIVGKAYFGPLLAAIEKVTVRDRPLMKESELGKVLLTDDPQELVNHLRTHSGGGFEKDPTVRYQRIAREIDETIALLDKLPPAVTFIGGRELKGQDPTLSVAEDVASLLTKAGVPLRVGGLAEVAGAVAKGAASADSSAEVQGLIVGHATDASAQPGALDNVRIHQALTELVAHKECIGRRSRALVALPGGMGTLSELFAVLTQVQCGHLPPTPIVLVGTDFWQPIFDAIKQVMLTDERKTIAPHDLDLVTITDDPARIAQIVADAGRDGGQAHLLPPADAEVLTPKDLFVQTAPGESARALPPWLNGGVHEVLPQRGAPRVSEDKARAALTASLSPRILDMLKAHNVDARDAAHVLSFIARTPESGARKIATLLAAGAGKETFRFLAEAAPYCHYMTPIETALALLDRWGPAAEQMAAQLAFLATSTALMNPDALKVALNGVVAPGAPGEGFATVIVDAAQLAAAGHKIYLEEHPGGLGDLIDATEKVAYQTKRVTSSHLGHAMSCAIRQLTGSVTTLPAPAGFKAVVQLDARKNRSLAGLSDAHIIAQLAQVPIGPELRVDEVHVRLDGRTLVLDRARSLVANHES
jgi:uncharacterized protein (TIGR00730 family)